MLTKSGTVTLGVGLVGYIRIKVASLSGSGTIDLRGVSCKNATRPTADPRLALIWIGTSMASEGLGSSDGILDSGVVSTNIHLVKLLPERFNLRSGEMIGFRFEGENLDKCEAKIMYEVAD